MRHTNFFGVFAIVTSAATLFGQGMALVGSGYSDPTSVRVAPGQITTLFMTGLRTVLSSQPITAISVPLPTKLAGISVTLKQSGSESIPVPLSSIQQFSICTNDPVIPPASGVTADCLVTAITLQIPFELVVVPPPPPAPNVQELIVMEDGNVSKALKLLPITDNLHIINSCDMFPSPKVPSAGFCAPLVTHAKGDLITADNPAQPGEEVVIWTLGLGQTEPSPKTGEASPTRAATYDSPLYLQFDFRINATPSRPYINRAAALPLPAPTFVGLTPGQVGLYQINVRIPTSIPALDRCRTTCSHLRCTLYDTVQSNLTIDVGANLTFDGAAICVQPPMQ